MLRILGCNDEVTVCEKCGKPNLKKTVILENTETLAEMRYGVDCAANALYGDKRKATKDRIELLALAATIKASYPGNLDKAALEIFHKTGYRAMVENGVIMVKVGEKTKSTFFNGRMISRKIPHWKAV